MYTKFFFVFFIAVVAVVVASDKDVIMRDNAVVKCYWDLDELTKLKYTDK